MKHVKMYEEYNFLEKMAKEIVELGFNKIKNEEHNLYFYIKQYLGKNNLSSNIIDKICDIIKNDYHKDDNNDQYFYYPIEINRIPSMEAIKEVYNLLLHSNI